MTDHPDGDPPTNDNGYYETDPETGQLVEQYSDTDFLDALAELEAASTGDVADRLGCSSRRARDRLKALANDEQIQQLETKGGYTWIPLEEKTEQ